MLKKLFNKKDKDPDIDDILRTEEKESVQKELDVKKIRREDPDDKIIREKKRKEKIASVPDNGLDNNKF
jgi:hypothetical protein